MTSTPSGITLPFNCSTLCSTRSATPTAFSPGFFVLPFTLDRLPPGTNVYASIGLSQVNTSFAANAPDPHFSAEAWISSFTVYLTDGSESAPQTPDSPLFFLNSIFIQNCATITFELAVNRADAIAQITVFEL